MSIEIELSSGLYDRAFGESIPEKFQNSGIKKGDLVLLIERNEESPNLTLLAEFNKITREISDYHYGISDSLSFNAKEAFDISRIRIGELILPKIRDISSIPFLSFHPHYFYFRDTKKIIKALMSEKIIGYKK